MPKKPNITRSMAEFNRLLAARERAQMAAMVTRWRQVEKSLEAEILRTVNAIAARQAAGLVVGATTITNLDDYRALLLQIKAEAEKYETFARTSIMAEQMAYGELGLEAGAAQLNRAGYSMAFNRLNVSAVQNMVGVTADGSPLFDVLAKRALAPEMIAGLTDKLIEGIALGYNPRKTAAMMADGLTAGLDKALVIARTEQIRVYRQANQQQYAAAGIEQKQRHAIPQERTCIACLALDGKIYPVDEDIESHPNCRCFTTPVIPGFNQPASNSGEGWLERQGEGKQLEILGPARFEQWKAGTPLTEFVGVKQSEKWGPTLFIKKLDK
jgi:SPP1 gp7 family putative phage head morphogenesis protein